MNHLTASAPAKSPLPPRRWAIAPLAMLALAAAPRSQEWVGFARNCAEVSAYSRNDLGNVAGEVMTRIDSREHAGWGTAIAGFRTVSGVAFASQAGITPQTIDIRFYPESGLNTELPCAGVNCWSVFAAGVPIPFGPVCMTIVGPPMAVPIAFSGDVFLSFKLPLAPFAGWPGDGIGIGIVAGYPGVFTDDFAPIPPLLNYDMPGPNSAPVAPTLLPSGTHGLRKILGAGYRTTRQHWFDLRHVPWGSTVPFPGAGGVGIVWNNQINYPTGVAGTSNFQSGTSPHSWASGANGNLGTRSDDVGMGITMAGLPGHFVFFAAQVAANFGTETPVTFMPMLAPPMSTGVLCLSLIDPLFVVMAVPSTNTEEFRFDVGSAGWLSGIPLIQQAFAFDIGTGLIHATPCDWMRF